MAPRTTLGGFIAFVRGSMAIPTKALPDASEWLLWSYEIAVATVSLQILRASPVYYALAVYNLAGDTLINYAPDVAGGDFFFEKARSKWKILDFVGGIVTGAGDESTSDTLVVPDALKNLTLADLQTLKTPYGRVYLGIAQQIGSIWGIS